MNTLKPQPNVSQSTPQSRGTAPNAEYHSDAWAKNTSDIMNVTLDLQSTQEVEFHNMLMMFIKRGKLGAKGSFENLDLLKAEVYERGVEFDDEFKAELKNAVDFCNLSPCPDSSSDWAQPGDKRRCEEIKWYLKDYCSKHVEIHRYQPLVIVLNHILRWMDDEPEFIFIINDPVIIKLEDEFAPKRKPDILLVKLESFKSWFPDCQDSTFDDCQTWITQDKAKDIENCAKPSWSDIIQFWELKCNKEVEAEGLSKQFVVNGMVNFPPNQAPTLTAPVSINQNQISTPNGKRKFEENNSFPKKKPKTASGTRTPKSASSKGSQTASGARAPPPETVPNVSKEVQCAYYALEVLRSSWNVSHVSGILLTDTALNVLWYDVQGCLKSHPLDIVEHLPLLLVLIKVQVHSKYLSGFVDIRLPEPYDSYKLDKFTGPLFQLTGRRTCHAILIPPNSAIVNKSSECSDKPRRGRSQKPDDEASADNQDDKASALDELFFKISWPEDKCDKEHHIIEIARKRAEEFLDMEYRTHVLLHLPDIQGSGVFPDTCTAIVRLLANFSEYDGSRSLYWITSKKLKSLASVVHDFDKFREIYFHLIRCHRLLWTIGIAHGDISFSNLMYDETSEEPRGILNDFDLAALMNPGDRSLAQTGTGTKIFMAQPLLEQDALDGNVFRLYRHDLESFSWVLLYACICVDPDGRECLDKVPIRDWLQADHVSVRVQKWDFLVNLPDRIKTYVIDNTDYLAPLVDTLLLWYNAHSKDQHHKILALKDSWTMDPAMKNSYSAKPLVDHETSDEALLRQVLKPWKWSEDLNWITFGVAKGKDSSN